jgi:hypothetical protein
LTPCSNKAAMTENFKTLPDGRVSLETIQEPPLAINLEANDLANLETSIVDRSFPYSPLIPEIDNFMI